MAEPFADVLAVGGRSNSLGRVGEVVDAVLAAPERLAELYGCLFEDDAWLRMRAADSLEKVCRAHPDWLSPYVDRLLDDLGQDEQPSIQWHLAEVFGQVQLTAPQRTRVIAWLEERLATTAVDWIVAADAMQTLSGLVTAGVYPTAAALALFEGQRRHRSAAVVKRADRLIASLRRADDGTAR